jgi:Icc-related predicted phosphoesterase
MKPTRITFVSDTHTVLDIWSAIPLDTDILVHCGDFTRMGTIQELSCEFVRFESFPQPEKLFVYGNHDFAGETGYPTPDKLTKLQISGATTKSGLKFWGAPYTPRFYDWAFMETRGSDRLKGIWSMIPEGLDVLVTHGPPAGILDRTRMDEEIGCYDLLNALNGLKQPPRIHAFGHCHGSRGVKLIHNTLYINAATKPVSVLVEHDRITLLKHTGPPDWGTE